MTRPEKLDPLWEWLEERTVRLAEAGDPRAIQLLNSAEARPQQAAS